MAVFSHRLWGIILGGAILLARPALAGWLGTDEPSYKNKTVSNWLLDVDPEVPPELSFEPFRHFDSNAVPFLVHYLKQTNFNTGNVLMVYREAKKRKEEASEDLLNEIRARAARALGEMGTNAATAVPVLLDALGDTDASVVQSSAISLGKIVSRDTNAVILLTATLEHTQINSAITGWDTNLAESPSLKTALALAQVAASTNSYFGVRGACIVALAKISADSPEMIGALVKGMATTPSNVRSVVASGMREFGDEAIPLLLKFLEDPDPRVQQNAVGTVWRRGLFDDHLTTNALVKAALISLLADSSAGIRQNAILSLTWVQPIDDVTVSALVGMLKDSSRIMRVRAMESLGKLGDQATSAVPALQEIARQDDRPLARQAAWAIKLIQAPHVSRAVEAKTNAPPAR